MGEPTLKLEIHFNPATMHVTSFVGPINNKAICYGILEAAKDVIRDWKPSAIAPPSAADLSKLSL